MEIYGHTFLILGGAGQVGKAVSRQLLAHRPSHLIIASIDRTSAEETAALLANEAPDGVRISACWGNIFVRWAYKDMRWEQMLADGAIRGQLLSDLLEPMVGELKNDILENATLARFVRQYEPDGIIDCINTATAFAYQNIYASSHDLLQTMRDVEPEKHLEAAEQHVLRTYIPHLVRHIQVLNEVMKFSGEHWGGVRMYIKVGTSGTGGMGLNIPYTHGEEKPSSMLLSKSALAGAHSLLMFLLARTPPTRKVVKEIKPTEAELKKYFEAYKELYRTSLKLKLAYYLLPYDEVRKEIKVTKEEIKEYYDNHKDTEFFRPEARKIRHILVVVKPGADEAKARKKAEKILAQIKSPKDFARLAQKYSDDPHSRNQGGDLGYVTKNEIFESLRGPIFSAKEGEIIGPLRSPLGYHIILVEKIRKAGYLPLKEAEAKIKAKIADRKLKDLAWDKANQIYDEVILLGGLEKWAEKHGISLSTTPLLSVNEPPADPAITSEVIEAAQKLEKGELGPLFEVQKGILIFKLAKRDNPHIPDFSKVEERVKRDYVREKARELSRKKAEELLTKLKEAKDEALVLKEAGLELKETDFFKRKEALGKSGLPPEVARASVTLASKGKWPEQPVSTAEAFYLLKLTDLKPADLKEFDKEKEALKERLTQEKRQRAFSTWYKHLRETAEIRLYHKIPNT